MTFDLDQQMKWLELAWDQRHTANEAIHTQTSNINKTATDVINHLIFEVGAFKNTFWRIGEESNFKGIRLESHTYINEFDPRIMSIVIESKPMWFHLTDDIMLDYDYGPYILEIQPEADLAEFLDKTQIKMIGSDFSADLDPLIEQHTKIAQQLKLLKLRV